MIYHVFVLSVGAQSVERKYIPESDKAPTREAAEKLLSRSQRKRIIGYRLARPTSAHRDEIMEREARERDTSVAPTRRRNFRYRQH